MYRSEATLDDLMREVLQELVNRPFNVKPTRGTSSEIIGSLLQLTNPRARLSRTETKGKAFSALGELLWYLAKSKDLKFISHYLAKYEKDAEEDGTIHGAYGPRLFNLRNQFDQIATVIDLLRKRPNTRRAVIQLFDAEDISKEYKEIPCTCSLQFILREGKLHMYASMRSNDAFYGLPHDIFAFTMLQEIVARSLGVELGMYNHAVASLHLYDDKKELAQQYLDEGLQSTTVVMPPMPEGDPWPSIKTLLEVEEALRSTDAYDTTELKIDPYWFDLIRLLQIHSCLKKDNVTAAKSLQKQMAHRGYDTYIEKRLVNLQIETNGTQ